MTDKEINDLKKEAARRVKTTYKAPLPSDPYGYVYVIEGSDGKVYVGQHLYKGENDSYFCSSCNLKFWHSLAKHGVETFVKRVVEWVTKSEFQREDLEAAERRWIEKLGATDPIHGYNLVRKTYSPFADLDVRAKAVAAMRATMATDEYKEKRSRVSKEVMSDPEVRKKISDSNAAAWQDEATREKWLEGLRTGHNSEEAKKNHSVASKSNWEDPEIRARNTAGIREAGKRPEIRKSIKNRVTEEWAYGERREKFHESMSTAWEKRRCYKAIRCVEDGLEFHSGKEAADRYGVTRPTVLSSAKNDKKVESINKTFVFVPLDDVV